MIEGGVKTNVVPPECVMEIDARTLPALDNEALFRLVRDDVESTVELVSDRFIPVETASDSAIVQAGLRATGTTEPQAFGGVSDFLHVRDVPAIVMGPGRSEQSHATDEWIETDQLERGVSAYVATIEGYFA